MLAFTDAQLAVLKEMAAPISPWLRPAFLQELASRLRVSKGDDIGDGDLHRAAVAARAAVLRAARVA